MSVESELKNLAHPKKALSSQSFFKTGKGQYGESDIFWGITVPEQRIISKKYVHLTLVELEALLTHKVHEMRLTALMILVLKYEKGSAQEKKDLFQFYLSHTDNVNNWDLVDSSAREVVGSYLFHFKNDYALLKKLARSKKLFARRIAILATWYFTKQNNLEPVFTISSLLLSDTEDLMHKAVGWMLREAGKIDEKKLKVYLKENIQKLPRTTLRYAIERFPKEERIAFLKLK